MPGNARTSPSPLIFSAVLLVILIAAGIYFGQDAPKESVTQSIPKPPQSNPLALTPEQRKKNTQPSIPSSEQVLSESITTDKNHSLSPMTRSSKASTALSDQRLSEVGERLENLIVPVFINANNGSDSLTDQRTAIDIFVSSLPDKLISSDFETIHSLLRDHLPYDVADQLALQTEEKYLLDQLEQEYLSSVLPSDDSPDSMDKQIAIAKHLAELRGEANPPEIESKPSTTLLEWQKTQARLQEIQTNSNDPALAMHSTLIEEYGSEVADDYLELSVIENQWKDKYDAYLVEKNIIHEAAISDQDKREQIESLIRQHYDENEWAAARGYDQMMNPLSENEG